MARKQGSLVKISMQISIWSQAKRSKEKLDESI
jgi:hypothetical protein